MSCIDPPPLSKELQNWREIEIEDFRKPWDHFRAFLASHGYALFDTPEYNSDPVGQTLPAEAARDPFHPADEEAFVHSVRSSYFKLSYYFQPKATCHYGLDRHRRPVWFKVVPRSDIEWQVVEYLSTDPMRQDARNHTVPIVEIIPAGDWVFIVQAYWGAFWASTPFDSIGTRLEMARQLLEGLAFMHKHGIGHGDIHPGNILWNHDGRRTIRQAWSPGKALYPFQSTFDFRFAFIDFGFSARFPPDDTHHLVEPISRPPEEFASPEQSEMDKPYDVFASDVYNLGKVLKFDLDHAIEWGHPAAIAIPRLAPAYAALLEKMIPAEPTERLSSLEALDSINAIIGALRTNPTAYNCES